MSSLNENSYQKPIKTTRQLTKIALMSCILVASFHMFSSVLYIEVITLSVVCFALVFPIKESLFACVIFGLVNMLIQGISPFSFMYLLIYPAYCALTYLLKKSLLKKLYLLCIFCGLLSFLTGQLLDLPFILLSDKVTLIYIALGFKTSLIQGCISGVVCMYIFKPIYHVLMKIERNYL